MIFNTGLARCTTLREFPLVFYNNHLASCYGRHCIHCLFLLIYDQENLANSYKGDINTKLTTCLIKHLLNVCDHKLHKSINCDSVTSINTYSSHCKKSG